MEEQYWNRFAKTGKIADYLYYRGFAICGQIMERHEGDESSESDYSDRHGNRISTHGGI
ncbi:MAG: hypothetical protein ACI4D9_12140 [Lachnospiraceae bacterium]